MMLFVVITSLVVISGLVGTLVYILHLLSNERSASKDAMDSFHIERDRSVKLTLESSEVRANNLALSNALSTKLVEITKEVDARKRLEAYRDELLQELTRLGDPKAIASRINAELRAFAKMSGRTDPTPKGGG